MGTIIAADAFAATLPGLEDVSFRPINASNRCSPSLLLAHPPRRDGAPSAAGRLADVCAPTPRLRTPT